MENEEYSQLVTAIIWDCQVVEAGLRKYLADSYEYVRRLTGQSLPFRFDKDDVERDSMRTLVRKFAKLSNDPDLINKLDDLVRYRNRCAHRAFALSVKQWRDSTFLTGEITELRKGRILCETCVESVLQHCKRAKALLSQITDEMSGGAGI